VIYSLRPSLLVILGVFLGDKYIETEGVSFNSAPHKKYDSSITIVHSYAIHIAVALILNLILQHPI
jgi:hypothetical protein